MAHYTHVGARSCTGLVGRHAPPRGVRLVQLDATHRSVAPQQLPASEAASAYTSFRVLGVYQVWGGQSAVPRRLGC